jgi:siroheme decarboxylase
MKLDNLDRLLIEVIQKGLPITSRPYLEIGQKTGMSETEVILRLSILQQQGLIKRYGVIVKHRQLGYTANAMVVWDIPDDMVQTLGQRIGTFEFISLCYQRPRHGKEWPFNLFCMIHGKSRKKVLTQLDHLIHSCNLSAYPREILFSKQCFKQRGAVYSSMQTAAYG